MTNSRRWYDDDPTLKEAMDLLSISSDDNKDVAAAFITDLQDQIASNVIEKIYETVLKYNKTGNRWYDDDPVMMRAIELLRIAHPDIQKAAAKKLIQALSDNNMDALDR